MSVVFRGATDAEFLSALHADAFGPAAWSAASLAASLTAGAIAFLAAPTESEPPQALAMARAAGDESELLTLGVGAQARRRGLGRALLDAAMADAAESGAVAMILEVADDNAAARALYEAAGFHRIGGRPFYYRRPYGATADAIIMRRALF